MYFLGKIVNLFAILSYTLDSVCIFAFGGDQIIISYFHQWSLHMAMDTLDTLMDRAWLCPTRCINFFFLSFSEPGHRYIDCTKNTGQGFDQKMYASCTHDIIFCNPLQQISIFSAQGKRLWLTQNLSDSL